MCWGKSNGTVTITATANGNKQLVEKVKVNVSAKKVSTNKKTVTLRIGQSTTVKASVSPSDATKKAITWTASNSKVATVNSKGVIKAKKAGTVTITAKAASATSGKAKVTVKAPVQAKSVTLNKSSVTLGKGHSTTLVAKVYPSNTDNKTIKWSTSNSKVVKVDSKGRLTGVGVGTATVKAATTNGKYKKVTVKVVLKPVKRTLATGTWTVGTHLAPGFYDVTTSSGSGNLIVTRGQYDLVVNEVLSATDVDYGNVTRVTAEFKKGDKIRISNLNNATFTPAKRSLRTTLHAGRWIVGKDIRAGRYTATVSEGSGNFIITRGEYHLVVNEILSTDPNFGVKQVTFTVKNGDDIQITGLNAVRFKRH